MLLRLFVTLAALFSVGVETMVLGNPVARGTSLEPRILSTIGPASWTSPNSQTLVAQCNPLTISFFSPARPQNQSVIFAINNKTFSAAVWNWAETDTSWKDAGTLMSVFWDGVDVAAGTVVWVELYLYDGGAVSHLLGDGITVQASNDTSCLRRPGLSDDYQGDSVHEELNDIMSGQGITTTVLKEAMFRTPVSTSTAVSSIPSGSSSLPSITSSATFPSSSPSATPSSSGTAFAVKKSTTGPIVGGVVAGVAALLLGAAVAFYFLRKKKRAGPGAVGAREEEKEPSEEGGGRGEESATPLASTWTYSHPSTPAPVTHNTSVPPRPTTPQTSPHIIQEVDAGIYPSTPPAYGSTGPRSLPSAPTGSTTTRSSLSKVGY